MVAGRKQLRMALAIAGGYLLIAFTNGIDWAIREPAYKAFVIARWELLYNGSACIATIAICLAFSRILTYVRGVPLVLAAAALCFSGGVAWVLLAQELIKLAGLPDWAGVKLGWSILFTQGGLASGTTLFLVSSVYFSIEYWRQAAEQKEMARQAMALAHQSQLQMLRYQLNPHFLFNALNSIRGMILEDPRRSRDMVSELADFLRYSLASNRQESTIAGEIEAIENYLAIQRIRFENQLDAVVDVAPAALNVAVPCFLIHPLVENAIKYGMKTSAIPLRVRIKATREADDLEIRVSNTGHLVEPNPVAVDSDGTQIGLKNVRERLGLAFPGRHTFSIEEDDGWVHAVIRLSLKGAPE